MAENLSFSLKRVVKQRSELSCSETRAAEYSPLLAFSLLHPIEGVIDPLKESCPDSMQPETALDSHSDGVFSCPLCLSATGK
jgi:hypothetical protein